MDIKEIYNLNDKIKFQEYRRNNKMKFENDPINDINEEDEISDPYISLGYKDREDYLNSLKEEYDPETVDALASLLGPSEDFDGLISMLNDSFDNF